MSTCSIFFLSLAMTPSIHQYTMRVRKIISKRTTHDHFLHKLDTMIAKTVFVGSSASKLEPSILPFVINVGLHMYFIHLNDCILLLWRKRLRRLSKKCEEIAIKPKRRIQFFLSIEVRKR